MDEEDPCLWQTHVWISWEILPEQNCNKILQKL